jgi:hypothetical protein
VTPLVLHRFLRWTVAAHPDALVFTASPATEDPAPAGPEADPRDAFIQTDVGILLEQELAHRDGADVRLPWDAWGKAHALRVGSLTAFSHPSHLVPRVTHLGEVGRGDFRYLEYWLDGHREVAVQRQGAYLWNEATQRTMHLAPLVLEMVNGAYRYNQRPEGERRNPTIAWRTLAQLKGLGHRVGARVEGQLATNTVVIPESIGMELHQDSQGKVTASPTLPGADISDAFARHVDMRLGVDEVSTVTLPGGKRARVVLDDDQREAVKRIKRARKLTGDAAKRLVENPAALFDGVTHAVDLAGVVLQYGERVYGVGQLGTTAPVAAKAGGPTIWERMGLGFVEDDQQDDKDDWEEEPDSPEPPPPSRLSLSLSAVDADTGAPCTVRLDEYSLPRLRRDARQALRDGRSTVPFDNRQLRAEPALVELLDRYLDEPSAEARYEDRERGAGGHLYLLVHTHEEELTPGLAPTEEVPAPAIREAPLVLPRALAAGVTLQPHQEAGLRWLATSRASRDRRGAILADDMGLGKTLQLLAHIATLVEEGTLDAPSAADGTPRWHPVLIVAPLLLVDTGTWTTEMSARFTDEGAVFAPWLVLRDTGLARVRHEDAGRDLLGKPLLDADRIMRHKVVITTYETLLAYQFSLAQQVNGKPLWSLVIYDEAQEVKSPSAKQSHASKALQGTFTVAATGTPVETRLRDLWNLVDTVQPGHLGTARDFASTYERPAMFGATLEERHQALEALRKALRYETPSALLLRRDKSILTSLPPRHEHRIRCPFTPAEREIHVGVQEVMRGAARNASPLANLQRLHLASQHPVLAGAPGSLQDIPGLIRDSARLQALLDTLERVRAAGEKALVFARSVEAQRLLAHVIGHQFRTQVDVVNGQTGVAGYGSGAAAGQVRREMLDRFRAAPAFAVIVLSPFVAGVGITLVEANHVLHYGRWWNPAIENQATDRAYRIGQQKPVHVCYFISTDPGASEPTFDEAVDSLLTDRNTLARDFLYPASEEAGARKLARAITGRGQDAESAQDPLAATDTELLATAPIQAAALLAGVAAQRGDRVVWLGEAGVHGAQLLVARGSVGALQVEVVRLAPGGDANEQALAAAAAVAWGAALKGAGTPPGCRAMLLVPTGSAPAARDAQPAGVAVRDWSWLAADARREGVPPSARWRPLKRTDSVPEAVARVVGA